MYTVNKILSMQVNVDTYGVANTNLYKNTSGII
jgi:hypothetical protein